MPDQTEAWPVDPRCPAAKHNRLGAARGDRGQVRCICARSLELLADYRRRKLIDQRARIVPIDRTHLIPPIPFIGGSCGEIAGLKIMDAYTDNPTSTRFKQAAREVCGACPVLAECDAWVTKAEKPAGAWDGMVAGMTPVERMRRVRDVTYRPLTVSG